MAGELKTYDIAAQLNSEESVLHYLAAAFEDGDTQLIKAALSDVARARGMSEIAKQAGLSRQGIYKALSDEGNPSLETLSSILKTFGAKLSVTAA